jgi:hypothetical protein
LLDVRRWELHAATSRARQLSDISSRDEGRAMLAEICDWFTADLKEAKRGWANESD